MDFVNQNSFYSCCVHFKLHNVKTGPVGRWTDKETEKNPKQLGSVQINHIKFRAQSTLDSFKIYISDVITWAVPLKGLTCILIHHCITLNSCIFSSSLMFINMEQISSLTEKFSSFSHKKVNSPLFIQVQLWFLSDHEVKLNWTLNYFCMMLLICSAYSLKCAISQKVMTEMPPLLSPREVDEKIRDRNVSSNSQILQTLT